MENQCPRVKRADGSSSHLINDLISAANANDRFKLLEDDAISPGNLTNSIHPLFHQLKHDERLHQALQLASQFLLHDQLLKFFVPLLYGRVVHDVQSGKRYLYDPLIRASKANQASMLAEVRQALKCLALRVKISFVGQQERTWARTIMNDSISASRACCCRAFQTQRTPKIELTEKFALFYHADDGYAKASLSAQFRHDFLFATTLVHEVVHALGVTCRGDLREPHYRLDSPKSEWGYAWENFMFGCIINPQDKNVDGTYVLMRKIWASVKTTNRNGGKEYSDVSMSWIAQWFRTETWVTVEKAGPTAIPPPTTHFKVQMSDQYGAWIVSSDDLGVRNDIAAVYRHWEMSNQRFETGGCSADSENVSHLVYFNELTATELQVSNVPVPQRVRNSPKPSLLQRLLVSKRQSSKIPARSANNCTSTNEVALADDALAYGVRRKRPNSENGDLLPLAKKHILSPPLAASEFVPINTPLIAACRASSPCST